MKKLGLVTITILMTVLLAGCGEKKETITCVQKNNDFEASFNIILKSNVLESMDIKYTADLSEYSAESVEAISKQDFCATFEDSMSEYKGAFVDCKAGVQDKKLNLTSKIDVNKIASTKEEKTTTSQALKEQFEKKGYTCTIK